MIGKCIRKKNLAFLVVMMDGSGLKSAKKKTLHSANKLPCIDRAIHEKCSQELTF
jgi:hypothetical protein